MTPGRKLFWIVSFSKTQTDDAWEKIVAINSVTSLHLLAECYFGVIQIGVIQIDYLKLVKLKFNMGNRTFISESATQMY